jgi:uncharacterized protein (TIGR04255 family)
VIENFEKAIQEVKTFFGELGLGEFKPVACELSYINHIPKGQGWSTPADIQRVFRDFGWNKNPGRFLPHPSKISWQIEFPLPENKGNLTVTLKQGTRTEDKTSLFILELMARGMAASTSDQAIREWFDLAHEWIVLGFADLTTPEVQKEIWGREGND